MHSTALNTSSLRKGRPFTASMTPDAARVLAASDRLTVPLSKLFRSPNNVRSKIANPDGIRQLAAMIEAEGLLHDLHVSPEHKKGQPTGRFGVEAGGRRLEALNWLAVEGRLHPDAPIGCRAVTEGAATAVSLSENLGQEPMSPVDEFHAFAKLAAEGKSVEVIAGRFGVTVVHVQRRMRLAAVAPELLTLYRDGAATLDQMMALACVDDPKRQLAAWKSLPSYSRTPAHLKEKLLQEEVEATDARVTLVTLARYEASGGTLRCDLFTDEVFLSDPGLLDLLVAEVLTEKADSVKAEGYAFVETLTSMGYEERQRFREAPAKYLPETDEVSRQREAMEAELDTVEGQLEAVYDSDDESDEASATAERLEAEDRALRARIEALRQSRLDTSGHDKSTLGAIVTTEGGKLKVIRGVMTADAARKAEQTGRLPSASGAMTVGTTSAAKPEYSERLMADLTSHRTGAVQAALTANVPVALVVLAHRLATDLLGRSGAEDHPVKVSARACRFALERDATNFAQSAAARSLDSQRERWETVMPQKAQERLAWLLVQPQAVVLELLAFCTAETVDLVQRRAARDLLGEQLATALNLDMADWWSAGEANFLAQVPKAKLVEVVTEAVGIQAASPLPKMKKPEACAAAALKLFDTRWLPTPLRRIGAASSPASPTATAAT